MAEIEEKVPTISRLLRERAVAGMLIEWREIFAICDDMKADIEARGGDYPGMIFRTFEAAAKTLADFQTAIYTSLVRSPKKGFFSLSPLKSRPFFRFISDNLSEHDLVDNKTHKARADAIVECERFRAWNHAARNYKIGND